MLYELMQEKIADPYCNVAGNAP